MSLGRRIWSPGRFVGHVEQPYSLAGPYDPGLTIGETILTQIHCHTTASDGKRSPGTVVNDYLTAGYGALAITDHDVVTTQPDGVASKIVGNELSPNNQHIISINSTYTRGGATNAQTIIDGIAAAGGKSHVAHPKWALGMTYAEMAALTGYMGLEIHNSHCVPGANMNPVTSPGYAVGRWDELLTGDRTDIWGFAVDDYHSIGTYTTYDVGRLRTFVASNSVANVVNALAGGHFVADVSNYGVTPGFPVRTDEGVSLTCAGATRIEAIGNAGAQVAVGTGTSLDYTYAGDERYVRLVAYGDYTEAFGSALSDRWQALDGTWTVAGGVLALASTATARRMILRRHRDGDFSAKVDVNMGADGDAQAALMFNVLTSSYYYMLRLGVSSVAAYDDRLAVGWTTNGVHLDAQVFAGTEFVPDASTWYTMAMDYVAATGTVRAKVWERGTAEPDWMITGSDVRWAHGAFGFRANRSVQFDNLYIDGFRTFYQPITVEPAA